MQKDQVVAALNANKDMTKISFLTLFGADSRLSTADIENHRDILRRLTCDKSLLRDVDLTASEMRRCRALVTKHWKYLGSKLSPRMKQSLENSDYRSTVESSW